MKVLIASSNDALNQKIRLKLEALGMHAIVEINEFETLKRTFKKLAGNTQFIIWDRDEFPIRQNELRALLKEVGDGRPVPLLILGSRGGRDPFLGTEFAYLAKPFRTNKFEQAVKNAYQRSNLVRSSVLFLGDVPPGFEKSGVSVKCMSDFENASKNLWKFGAFIIRLEAECNFSMPWMKRLKKSKWGTKTPFIVLGREPDLVKKWRLLGDYFFNEGDWSTLLNLVLAGAQTRFEVNSLLNFGRLAISRRQWSEARELLQKSIEIDSTRVDILCLYSMVLRKLGDSALARQIEDKIIQFNPCSPYPYLVNDSISTALVEMAVKYCPSQPQIRDRYRAQTEPDHPSSKIVVIEASA